MGSNDKSEMIKTRNRLHSLLENLDVGIPSTLIRHSSGLALIGKYLYNVTSANGTPMYAWTYSSAIILLFPPHRYYVKVAPDAPFKFGPYIITFVAVVAFSLLTLVGFVVRI